MTNGAVALYTIIALFFILMLSLALSLMSIVTQLKQITTELRSLPTTGVIEALRDIHRELANHNNYSKGIGQR